MSVDEMLNTLDTSTLFAFRDFLQQLVNNADSTK